LAVVVAAAAPHSQGELMHLKMARRRKNHETTKKKK
jgi:hypothetical protein